MPFLLVFEYEEKNRERLIFPSLDEPKVMTDANTILATIVDLRITKYLKFQAKIAQNDSFYRHILLVYGRFYLTVLEF